MNRAVGIMTVASSSTAIVFLGGSLRKHLQLLQAEWARGTSDEDCASAILLLNNA